MKRTVVLRPISLQDTKNIVKWRNMPFVIKNLYSQQKITEEQHIAYYHSKIETGSVKQFIISLSETCNNDNVYDIGTVFIKNIDNHNHKAEFGLFIGDQTVLGKGYGQIATKLMLKYAFDDLSLNRVYLTVLSENTRAIHTYKKSGFVYEGELRQSYCGDGGFMNVTIMGITKDIWNNQNEK